jgi:hypothetical protein
VETGFATICFKVIFLSGMGIAQSGDTAESG